MKNNLCFVRRVDSDGLDARRKRDIRDEPRRYKELKQGVR
jgi:hypothetical protein